MFDWYLSTVYIERRSEEAVDVRTPPINAQSCHRVNSFNGSNFT